MINKDQELIIISIKKLASLNPDIEVVWLYGSRARSLATKDSDFDLAVAFKTYIENPLERRLRPELLALSWQKELDQPLSVIDINQASLSMAYTVVEDNFNIYCANNYRRMVEEQRIMSKWELDYLYHRKHYA
ncbi:MAG: nucleotidyltransferase domain-containing protein [Gammaproteobacteria bacterium]|nr:nucleotidyltransferase domain-containing protein [Gammaproteobacteria bacterium]